MQTEYTIKKLSRMAGISTRTLRHYDDIGLLKPARISAAKYRIYGQHEIDLLQQILFYRELGFALDEIRSLITADDFDRQRALHGHLAALEQRKAQLDALISTVIKTINAMKGESTMTDAEKFEGFKQKLLQENEEKYGDEIRAKYGDEVVDRGTQKWNDMTQTQFEEMQRLSREVNALLGEAVRLGDPASDVAQRACEMHKQWLMLCWPEGTYSREAHLGLTQMYCDDERFKTHYEAIAPGATEFFRNAMLIYHA